MPTKKKTAKKAVKKAVKKRAPAAPLIPKHIYERVDKGVQLLDLLVGRKEWLSRMNLGKFDIKDPNTCVAGSIWAECYDFDLDGDEDDDTDSGYDLFCKLLEAVGGEGATYKFGFNTDDDSDDHETQFQQLQDVWVRTIQALKKRAR